MPSIKGDALLATWERRPKQNLSHGFHQHFERDTGYDYP
jgi:hypothetical protein